MPGLVPIKEDHGIYKYRFVLLQLGSVYHFGKLVFLEQGGKDIVSCSSDGINVKFRSILLTKVDDSLLKFSDPLRVTRWLNVDKIYSVVHLIKTGDFYEISESCKAIYREAMQKQVEKKDALLSKVLASSDVPMDYLEVKDIVDRKVDPKTHNFLYLVKFNDEDEHVWLPSQNFFNPVHYQRRGGKKGIKCCTICHARK